MFKVPAAIVATLFYAWLIELLLCGGVPTRGGSHGFHGMDFILSQWLWASIGMMMLIMFGMLLGQNKK